MKLSNALRISLVAMAVATASAFAASDRMLEHTEKVLDGAKTSLSEAVSTAEGEVGGKAYSARLTRCQKRDFYDVRVLKGDQLTDVRVGTDDGRIFSIRPMEHGYMAKAKAAAPEREEQTGNKSSGWF